MRIRLDWRNPTQEHAQMAVFVNGGLCGVLTVRQQDVVGLSQIVRAGCAQFSIDQFEESGDPGPYEPVRQR